MIAKNQGVEQAHAMCTHNCIEDISCEVSLQNVEEGLGTYFSSSMQIYLAISLLHLTDT